MRAVRDLSVLGKYVGIPAFKAEDGGHGQSRSRHGKNGEDLVVDVPVGTAIRNTKTDEIHRLITEGDEIVVLKGGHGGFGNEHFKSSENQTPTETTDGKPGEAATLYIELELSADVGLIGFPNAGKSTLLNELTNAQSRIGAYPFTTVEPHLGDMYGFIIADIPGLIAGASSGKGLGHKFLRHVRRTDMLVHCISLENEDMRDAYDTLRSELGTFDTALLEKEEWIVFTKADIAGEEKLQAAREAFKDHAHVYVVSAYDDVSVKEFRDTLTQKL